MIVKPTPWTVEPLADWGSGIFDADGMVLVEHAIDDDVAELIVRCVNAHDALLAALKDCEWLDLFAESSSVTAATCVSCGADKRNGHFQGCNIRAAIAAAEGTK